MHQSTTPSLSQTIWPRWASKQFLTLPIVETLLPVTFAYSLSCRYERIEEMKEAVTKVIDMLTQEDFHGAFPEVVGTVQQVHCCRRRLLRRGLEFHVCTINKSANTKKSLEIYLMILVLINFYIFNFIMAFNNCSYLVKFDAFEIQYDSEKLSTMTDIEYFRIDKMIMIIRNFFSLLEKESFCVVSHINL